MVLSERDIVTMTGCKPNCHRDKYKVEQMFYETSSNIPGDNYVDGKRVAKVSFAYAGASYVEEKEYFAYDEKVNNNIRIYHLFIRENLKFYCD